MLPIPTPGGWLLFSGFAKHCFTGLHRAATIDVKYNMYLGFIRQAYRSGFSYPNCLSDTFGVITTVQNPQ